MSSIDPESLARWYSRFAPALVLYVRQWLDAATAEDVVQEVFASQDRELTEEEATRVQSHMQLRGLQQGSVVWAQGQKLREGEKHLPLASELGILVLGNYFTVEYVPHPHSGVQVPPDFAQWPAEQRRQWVNEHASYVLIPRLVEDFDSKRVAGFEKPEVSDGRQIAVVFNDNHGDDMPIEKARALIQEQAGMTLEELVEQQAKAAAE